MKLIEEVINAIYEEKKTIIIVIIVMILLHIRLMIYEKVEKPLLEDKKNRINSK